MPTPTDNHNLDVGYVEGESWDYNDEFQTIEERLVVRDTEANLSNYTPHSAATFIATDTGAVYDGDGANWNDATRSYASVAPDELSNTYQFVSPGTAVGDINTLLSTEGTTVVFESGTHTLDDRIENGANGNTLIVENGATITFADSATPTTLTDAKGTNHTPLVYSDGFDDFSAIIRGTINANNTNHTNTAALFIKNGSGVYVDAEGGELADANDTVWLVDLTDSHVGYVKSTDYAAAVIAAEGLEDSTIDTVYGRGGDEVLDLNGRCEGVTIGSLTGADHSSGSQLLDINQSADITIGAIHAADNVSGSMVLIEPHSGVRFTSKAAIDNSDNVTIKAITGTCGENVLRAHDINRNLGTVHNLTVEGINAVSTGDVPIWVAPEATGQFDNLKLSGYVDAQDAGSRAAFIGRQATDGNNYQQSGVTVDLVVESAGTMGVAVEDWDLVSGEIRAEGTGAEGCVIYAHSGLTCSNLSLTVQTINNATQGLSLTGGGGSIDGQVRGVSLNNGSNDVNDQAEVDGLYLDMKYGTKAGAATSMLEASYS